MTELVQPMFSLADRFGLSHVAAAGLLLVLLVLLVLVAFRGVLPFLVGKSETGLDDRVVGILERPALVTAVLVGGLAVLVAVRETDGDPHEFVRATFATVGLLYWTRGLSQVGIVVLDSLAGSDSQGLVQARTLPLLQIVSKIVIWGGGIYGLCLAWKLDLTAWVASAGIVGIAVGFAAKDTLSNLFAGVFILADAPYRIGDYLVLESGERGMVTEIGMRTTRLMTRDDIQIIVPNAVMANSKILNETGGHTVKERVRCPVSVAYGSDVDRVRELLLEVAAACPDLVVEPEPRVRFRALGESGLDFELMGWIPEPSMRGRVLDDLYMAVYKRFHAEGVEIPYPKRDVYLHRVEEDGTPLTAG